MYKVKDTLSAFVDILFPKTCHICSKGMNNHLISFDEYICSSCVSEMKKTPVTSCSMCGETFIKSDQNESKELICQSCKKDMPAYQNLITCYIYGEKIKKLICRFKYDNRPYLAKTLSRLMREKLEEEHSKIFAEADYLVPVPLHPARQREREFNQSIVLALEISKTFNKPVALLLKRIRNTKSQACLENKDRLNNISGAFAALDKFDYNGKSLLLIDDVVTTTATVREAAKTLKKSGARNISVLAFAKG